VAGQGQAVSNDNQNEKDKMKLPKTIFVTVEEPGNDNPWLQCHESFAASAEKGEVKKVGEYRLVYIKSVSLEVKVKP
jgi:hypothetical protein